MLGIYKRLGFKRTVLQAEWKAVDHFTDGCTFRANLFTKYNTNQNHMQIKAKYRFAKLKRRSN